MPRHSEIVRMPGGGTAIVCFSGRRPKTPPCACCGTGRATIQCDFPLEPPAQKRLIFGDEKPPKTCDAYLCRSCAVRVGRDRDYCPHHLGNAAA